MRSPRRLPWTPPVRQTPWQTDQGSFGFQPQVLPQSASSGGTLGFGGGRESVPPDPVSTEEESNLLGKTMGAVGYLGDSLMKPWQAVWSTAMNGPKGLLNAIPFYDTIQEHLPDSMKEILPEAPKTSGWDVGEALGMPANKEGFDAWDIPKAAIEFLDPLLLLTTVPKVAGTTAKALETAGKAAGLAGDASKIAEAGSLTEQIAAGTEGLAQAARGERPIGSLARANPGAGGQRDRER